MQTPFTQKENRLALYLKALAVLYAVATLGYFLPGIFGLPDFAKLYTFLVDPAYANNSTIMISFFFFLSWVASANVRKYRELIVVLILASIVAEIASILLVLFSHNNYQIFSSPNQMHIVDVLLVCIIFEAVIAGVLLWFFITAERSRLGLLYLSPAQFHTLKALAEVCINGMGDIVIPAEDVAHNVDGYLSNFRAKSKWISKIVLTVLQVYPIFSFNVPLSYMRREKRLEYLKKRFYQDISFNIIPRFLAVYLQAMIRMGKQLCFMGYYNDERVFKSIGYTKFSARADHDERLRIHPPEPRKLLKVRNEQDIEGDVFTTEIAVIGTGAAASVIAYGLVEKGHEVLMIERGEHHDRSEFSENEFDQVSKLYADGALQMASDFRFQVFQGSCVGGSTVVNNAVCFDMPMTVLDLWNEPQGLNAGLDKMVIQASMNRVNGLIGTARSPQAFEEKYLNPSGKQFTEGIRKLGFDVSPDRSGSVAANLKDCIGCGYCNIGCQFGKKMSMLDNLLPKAQAMTSGKLEIIAGCEVLKFVGSGNEVKYALGEFRNGRRIKIKAKKFVLSAGAISSSIVLLRSGISKNAGKRLAFNVGSQITAAFSEKINSFDGLQISHFLQRVPSQGYVIETWFNPPMFQSTATPGWFEEHFRNMLRYSQLACGGVLVGSESNAEVRVAGLTGREIRYTPTQRDFSTLLEGLKLAGNIFFEAGAESVMPNTFKYYEFMNKNELEHLSDLVKDNSQLGLGTGHPQGGNVLSKNKDIGVIGPDFKVHDYTNLYVADASVFPSSIGVNPQVTTMTLADYAVQFIA